MGSPSTNIPSSSPSILPTTYLFIQYQNYLFSIFNNTHIFQKSSSAYQALYWIYHEDNSDQDSSNFLQRYILAVFYYSTNGDNWYYCNQYSKSCNINDKGSNWLSPDVNECDWYGISCDNIDNTDWQVTKIQLGTSEG